MFSQTNALLSRLIGIFIGAGVVTTAVAIFNVMVFFVAKSVDLFAPPAIVLSKLYTNSLLVQLNCRCKIPKDENINVDFVNSDSRSPMTSKNSRESFIMRNSTADYSGAINVGKLNVNTKIISVKVMTEKEDSVSYFIFRSLSG